jgi:hypothetical protein
MLSFAIDFGRCAVSLLIDTDVDSSVVDEFMFLSGQARDAAFMSTEREIRRLQALQAGRIRHTETTCGFVDDAFHSVISWLQAVTNVARGTASFRVGVARLLEDMPRLAAAVAEGRVGDDQLRLLVRLHTNDRCRPHLADSDALLTGHAASLTLRDFREVCQRWESWADPDGTQRDHELSHQNRSVKLSQTDAGFVLTAQGSAAAGEELDKIIRAHEQAEYETDIAERADLHGDQAHVFPLARTGRQRRFDAFQAVMLKGAATDQAGHVATTVNLVTTPENLNRVIRAYLGGDTALDAPSDRLRLCETVNGTPVSDRELLIAALTGQIRRVITDSAGRVIDLGRRQRLFTGAAREAVKLFGDRCCWPGCEHNLGDMHLDHLEAFATNGTTDPNNAAVMCPAHNQAKEHHKIRVKRDETGWHHYRRDGTEITPRDG